MPRLAFGGPDETVDRGISHTARTAHDGAVGRLVYPVKHGMGRNLASSAMKLDLVTVSDDAPILVLQDMAVHFGAGAARAVPLVRTAIKQKRGAFMAHLLKMWNGWQALLTSADAVPVGTLCYLHISHISTVEGR